MARLSIDTFSAEELRGQPVLVRIDAEDEIKLRDALPTLALVAESGARVVVATHVGLPPDAPRLDAVAARLSELLGRPIAKLAGWQGEGGLRAVSRLDEGEIVMLENLALEPGEESGDEKLAEALSQLAEIYCNDAFALAHEIRASTVGVAKRAKRPVAGLAFERELTLLEVKLGAPQSPSLALLAGAVSKDKLLLAEELARRCECTLLAGQLVLPFLIARELLLSSAAVTEEMVTIAARMLREARDSKRVIHTPADFTVTDQLTFERLSRGDPVPPEPPLQNVGETELDADHVICDIGKATRWSWSDWFGPSRTLFWHGPVGISEIDLFCAGSRFLATEIANRTWPTVHRTVVCGTSLVAALRRTGFPIENIRHLTYAGRASLHYFAGRPLPAVDVLSESSKPLPKPGRVLIPLNGSARDAISLRAAAESVTRDAEIVLLHVRAGPDEEQYPDIVMLNPSERLERRIESERVFARANAILAERGLFSASQAAVQGRPTAVILRYAERIRAELIVLAAQGTLAKLGARRIINGANCATLVARLR